MNYSCLSLYWPGKNEVIVVVNIEKSFLDQTEEIINELNIEIPDLLKEQSIPGLALTLVTKSEIIWQNAFGYLDREKTLRVDENSLFCLQSTTKTITALVFLLVAQDGRVHLDDPIINYYPELYLNSNFGDDQISTITFKHLLSHTSGLPRESRVGGVFSYGKGTWETHINGINGSWLKFPVGSRANYSNIGFDLVTYILERITGKKYPDLIQELLGDPLGIKIHFDVDPNSFTNTAKGYLGNYPAKELDIAYGCGGAFLSIKDMGTLIRFFLNFGYHNGIQIISEDYFKSLRPLNAIYGYTYSLGNDVKNQYGTTVCGHPGGGFGYISELLWVPDHGIGLSLFMNNEYCNLGKIKTLVNKIIKKLLLAKGVSIGLSDFPYRHTKEVKLKPSMLQKYVGMYSNVFANIMIDIDDKGLFLSIEGKKDYLMPQSETEFVATIPDGIIFLLDDNDKLYGMDYYSKVDGLITLNYLSIPSTTTDNLSDKWKEFEGIYQFGLYNTDGLYLAIKYEKGNLYLNTPEKNRLYRHSTLDNVFFTFLGSAVVFEDDYLLKDNTKAVKIDDPVKYFNDIYRKDNKHNFLQKWSIDHVINLLFLLERTKEAETLNDFKKNHSWLS